MLQRWKKIDYSSPSSASGGAGIVKQFPWYATPYIDMSAAVFTGVSQAIGASIGDVWWLGGKDHASGGNAFMFVKADAGLTVGQLVTFATPTTGTITVAGSPVTTTAAVTTNISNVTAGVNGEVNNWIYANITSATGVNLRRIKANTAAATGNFTVALPNYLLPNSPLDLDVFDTLPTNADPCCIIRPYHTIVCTAATIPVGVTLGTVTQYNYTIVQVAGLAAVASVGNGVALVSGTPALPIAGGAISGFAGTATALTGTAAPQFLGAGMVVPLFASAAASLLIPCYVNFIGQ